MSRFNTLFDWLSWMENFHPVEIDLGLARVYKVARSLGLIEPPNATSHEFSGQLVLSGATVFTVAGTNGKGTCTATITALLAKKFSVGTYTSPHFHHYAERICINGQPVDDALICDAFAAIDQARADTSLSYFEFGTLAALWIFVQQQVDYVVLEVGLGGRLDAVNIVDTDIAVITSIDIDHQEWLGNDRNTIAKEKLGIARVGKPLIIAEALLTPALKQAAECYPSRVINRDFVIRQLPAQNAVLIYGSQEVPLSNTGLHPHSVSAALVALGQMDLLPDDKTLNDCLERLSVVGRCEHMEVNGIALILDVAHNPAAVRALNTYLQQSPCAGQTLFVMAIMADKDYEQVIGLLSDEASQWFVGDLKHNSRALSADVLAKALLEKQQIVRVYAAIEQAFDNALTQAKPHDRIVVLGSFFTVAAIKDAIESRETDLIGRKV